MTPTERHAIKEALVSADFSRSPDLQHRLRHSLRQPPEWGLLGALVLGAACWALLIWSIL